MTPRLQYGENILDAAEFPVIEGNIHGVRIVGVFGDYDAQSTPARAAPLLVDGDGYELIQIPTADAVARFIRRDRLDTSRMRRGVPMIAPSGLAVVEIPTALAKHHFLVVGPMESSMLAKVSAALPSSPLVRRWASVTYANHDRVCALYALDSDIEEVCAVLAEIIRSDLKMECSTAGWASRGKAKRLAHHLVRAGREESDMALASVVLFEASENKALGTWRVPLTLDSHADLTPAQKAMFMEIRGKLAPAL